MPAKENRLIRLMALGHARFYNAELERLREGIDESVIWHTPGSHPLSGTIVGLDAVFEWMRKSAEVTDGTFRAEDQRIFAADEYAVVTATWRGERKGLVLEMPGVQVFRCDPVTSKVVESRIWVYDDESVDKFWSA